MMQYINGSIGCVLLIFGLVHIPHPMPLIWLPYLCGAALAFITVKPQISIGFARILAIGTAVAMFFFFAGFFVVAPKLSENWYALHEGWLAVARLVAGFMMLPILSEYSCRLKAECAQTLAERRTFFTAPDTAPNHSPNP